MHKHEGQKTKSYSHSKSLPSELCTPLLLRCSRLPKQEDTTAHPPHHQTVIWLQRQVCQGFGSTQAMQVQRKAVRQCPQTSEGKEVLRPPAHGPTCSPPPKINPKLMNASKILKCGTSLVVQWLGSCASMAGCLGSIPGWGTQTPYAVWHGQK